MIKKTALLLSLSLLTNSLFAQIISSEQFDQLLITKRNVYRDSSGKTILGCGTKIECLSLPITFTFIKLEKQRQTLELSAYINPALDGLDTVGSNYYKIFIAKPVRGKLTAVRVIADVQNDMVQTNTNTFVYLKQGRCTTEFTIEKGDRLYFESPGIFYLMEYDVSQLLIR